MAFNTAASLIAFADAIIYVQAAGATATPGTADQLGFCTDVEIAVEPQTTTKGPYVGLATIKNVRSGEAYSGSFSVDYSAGADATRALLWGAAASGTSDTRVKITLITDPTTGEKHVIDQTIVTATITGSADGYVGAFSFVADSYTYTAAS
jgi:hypothetical protein